jgi:uncharacterized MAPEG superfamily protein
MTTVLWCLLLVSVLPIVLAITGTAMRGRALGTLDNNNPRQQAQQLTGAPARIYAAQQNAWEALALFTAAVVAAYVSEADPERISQLALAFVAFRVLHAGFYAADLATLRSLAFGGGMISAVWMFVTGLI